MNERSHNRRKEKKEILVEIKQRVMYSRIKGKDEGMEVREEGQLKEVVVMRKEKSKKDRNWRE